MWLKKQLQLLYDLSLLALENRPRVEDSLFLRWSQPKGSSVVVLKGPPDSSSFPPLAFCKWAPSFISMDCILKLIFHSCLYLCVAVWIALGVSFRCKPSDVPPGRMGWEIQWVRLWRLDLSLVRDGAGVKESTPCSSDLPLSESRLRVRRLWQGNQED